jgi:hypothetical protein
MKNASMAGKRQHSSNEMLHRPARTRPMCDSSKGMSRVPRRPVSTHTPCVSVNIKEGGQGDKGVREGGRDKGEEGSGEAVWRGGSGMSDEAKCEGMRRWRSSGMECHGMRDALRQTGG